MTMLLSMQNLSKAFGGLEVVRELSFDVPERTATALIGPNGAGKTTVFNLISGVYPVTSGSIRFRGSDIVNLPSRYRIKRGIARSFQNIRLIPRLSAIDNLLIGQHVTLTRPFDVMRPFRLVRDHEWICAAKAELSAFGLGQYADEPVGLLPYGIRKRVDLIRATLSSPSVLMLDEPAAGLNASETRELHSHLDILKERGVTLLVIEHDMQFIRSVCEKIVVLNFGCKIAEGSFDQVRTDEQVREAYLGAEQAA
ncbi:branched-chain amino acid transport system ATP-binding protein [Bradyrhizobium japonicum USDA 38]|uniref:ABC transporter ATP-binding protein n=1 Tax=Bradyrhizobium japonicum TaxID=375 RepID=UPI000412FC65|nr:ABC transporter ATP-binding protein [Bradyrhizobium japonicum]MCS3897365.1 branched-chain amino acid transport system ATP-binding protein [Bradyrhizobium japonicum USDA 38]MCS3949880.1 branched-chain amino acid transport system ATP-binding protein [Bradyrhizobium japonicum]